MGKQFFKLEISEDGDRLIKKKKEQEPEGNYEVTSVSNLITIFSFSFVTRDQICGLLS